MNEELSGEELILEWKKHYGYVYAATLDGELFVYRLITYKEYEAIREQAEDKMEVDEQVCELCVLDPDVDWRSDIYAGFTESIARTVLEESLILAGPDPSKNYENIIFQKQEELATSFIKQLPLIIKHCFNELTLSVIEDMPLPEQLDLYVRANWMLKNLEGTDLMLEKDDKTPQ